MKKRWISLFLTAVMVFSMIPAEVMAENEGLTGDIPEEEQGPGFQDICISTPEMELVWDGEVREGAQFPEGLSYAYDSDRDVHVLTMENMTMTESVNIDGWGWSGEIPKVEIVLKGENVMDTREQDYGEFHSIIHSGHADVTILSGEEGSSLAFYGTDCSAITSNDGSVTIDGATITARCEIGENPEGGQCLNGGSDYLITGGAELDLLAGWIGIIVSGAVTFEDCTVTTNRIHVHSHVEMDEAGNVLSTDQQTMTIGEGAVVNIVSAEEGIWDAALMLLDGSTLKVAGGTLNCDFRKGPGAEVMVGFDGDCATNTLLIESGEMNVIGSKEQEWQNLMNLDKGRLIQTGGKLKMKDGYFGLSIGNNSDARFEGGEAAFENCYVGIYHPENVYGAEGDSLSLAGTNMTFTGGRFGMYLASGRSSITGGNIVMNIGPEEELEQAIYVDSKLVMSGGDVLVESTGIGMLVMWRGDFRLQGGKMGLRSGDRGTLVSYGLVDLRGGELNLRGNSHTFAGINVEAGGEPHIYLGENVFLRTEDAALVEEYDEGAGEYVVYYADSEGNPCIRVSFGTSGGIFAGEMDMETSELSVGVPFVVSADLALGESSGTAVFTLPDGLHVKGQASVNGSVVASVYDADANTLTVPVERSSAAIRFYAVADKTMDEAAVSCAVTVKDKTHELNSPVFSVDGLRMELPATLATDTISLRGTAAPGGVIRVYEVSDEANPVLLNGEDILVNGLGTFSGSAEIPALPDGETSHIYRIRVELWCGEELIDTEENFVSYTSHAAALKSLTIRNDYHGAKLDEILTNDILVENGTVYINGSKATKAYNYFPEYPTFFFRAEFEEHHSEFCCPDGPERHIISARVEAGSRRGEKISVPLRYNAASGTFDGYEDFPNWAPEYFAVYWVEEGVVNRESVYQAAIDDMSTYGGAGWQYENILNTSSEQLFRAMDEYLNSLERTDAGNGVIEYSDAENWIFRIEREELDYNTVDLSDGFVPLSENNDMWVKSEADVDAFSACVTLAIAPEGAQPVAVKQTVYINYLQAGAPAARVARSMVGASAEQRAAVFVATLIPAIGDAVQAVDSKLLQDSLIEFDSQFSDDMMRLTDAIMATMYYRCPYNGRQLRRGNTEAAEQILKELEQLRVEYNNDYQANKDNIRDDMKESFVGGLTLGMNKFANKRTRELFEELKEGWETLEEYVGYAEYLNDLIQDPEGTLQDTVKELMTPKGLVKVGAELAAENELIDDETKDLLNTLAAPDSTYRDARDFMVKYRDKLTDLSDRYMNALQNEIQGSGTGNEDCKPPDDPGEDPPTLPGEAGGPEIPIPAIKDPSGYVYEGVELNRLSDVMVTLYYSDGEEAPEQDADALGLEPFDMSIYEQANPLYTDALGQYQWMVPDGWWQVKYEKDGYETIYSDWLPVPPPQTEVNVGMVKLGEPSFSMEDGEGCIYLSFDRYLVVDSLEIGLFAGDEENGYNEELFSDLIPGNSTIAPDGETRLASEFTLYYAEGAPAYVQLRVDRATTHAGAELAEALTRMVTINPSNPVIYSWEEDRCEVALRRELADHILPFAASYEGGQMKEICLLTTQGAVLTGDRVQVIFLHADSYEPLCPPILCER